MAVGVEEQSGAVSICLLPAQAFNAVWQLL